MLKSLHIRNYALIRELDISFRDDARFVTLTGETGAGKSIILGAMGMLLGDRTDVRHLMAGADKCVIEAVFDIDGLGLEPLFADNELDYDAHDCIIRRELNASGKSRAFVNDSPVTVAVLKAIGIHLVDIHSQHQNLLLASNDFQIGVLDAMARNSDIMRDYAAALQDMRGKERRLREFRQTLEQRQASADFMAFQLKELSAANLVDGEMEALEAEAKLLDNAGDIRESLATAHQLLSEHSHAALSTIYSAQRALQRIADLLPQLPALTDRLDSAAIELDDIDHEVADMLDGINFDPSRQDEVNARLDQLNALLSKYHKTTVADLIAMRDRLAEDMRMVNDSDEALAELQSDYDKALQHAMSLAQRLSESRRRVADIVCRQVEDHLHALGMPASAFAIDIATAKALTPLGQDEVSFRFSAGKGIPLQPLAEVASGGEIARVMLSLKSILSAGRRLSTLVFDEIDTGVSGHIAEKMALLMQAIAAQACQVLCITHLPQIAAAGKDHLLVYKQDDGQHTTTHIRRLTAEERIDAVAHMLSGAEVSQAAIDNARALLRLD